MAFGITDTLRGFSLVFHRILFLSLIFVALEPTKLAIGDDFFSTPRIVLIKKKFGLAQYRPYWVSQESIFVASNSTWTVDNCGWAGTTQKDAGPRNPYPILIDEAADGVWFGGTVTSLIPQTGLWNDLYCNSAAATSFRNAPNFTFSALRIDGAWDGVRFGSTDGPAGALINTWMTNIRDDCVENDRLQTLLVRDVLFDGCFSGISLNPGAHYKGEDQYPTNTVTIDHVLMRLQKYLFKPKWSADKMTHISWFKMHWASPALKIYNSIFAFDDAESDGIRGYMPMAWAKTVDCHNNLILWLSDDPFPKDFPDPPTCFTINTGQEARDIWENAREIWIKEHPNLSALADN